MDKSVWLVSVLLAFQLCKTSSQDVGWWKIDCGIMEDFRTDSNYVLWDGDKIFTDTGKNQRVMERHPFEEMMSLRYFPHGSHGTQNCYNLPVYPQTLRYIIRAGFYYGNHDAQHKPPTFNITIDDKPWSTVNTSSSVPIYREIIYVTRRSGNIKVCLVQIRDDEVPFISSLEILPLWVNLYKGMGANDMFHLVTRTSFGGDEIRFTGLFSAERYNRIWTRGEAPPNCTEASTIPYSTSLPENDPPHSLFSNSIMSDGTSPTITLFVNLSDQLNTCTSAYFVFYFVESAMPSNESETSSRSKGEVSKRIILIYINGEEQKAVATLESGKSNVVTISDVNVFGPRINVTLGQGNMSGAPPIISAMEIFLRVPDSSGETYHRQGLLFPGNFGMFHVLWLIVVIVSISF